MVWPHRIEEERMPRKNLESIEGREDKEKGATKYGFGEYR